MASNTLRVRARGAALVQDIDAMASSPRRYVGKEWVVVDGQHGLKSIADHVDVPSRAEYMMAVKEGSLWAADEETATACGVKFDPLFGGEHEVSKTPALDAFDAAHTPS